MAIKLDVRIEGIPNPKKFVRDKLRGPKIRLYNKLLNDAISEDLLDAYHKIVASVKDGKLGVYSAVKQIRGGIEVNGDLAEKQAWPDYGRSHWSNNEYGRKRSKGGILITINNILDLNWRQGYIALPDKSLNINWVNRMRPLKRMAKVRLGDSRYVGMTPEDTLIAYMDDISAHKNSGENLDAAIDMVMEDIVNIVIESFRR